MENPTTPSNPASPENQPQPTGGEVQPPLTEAGASAPAQSAPLPVQPPVLPTVPQTSAPQAASPQADVGPQQADDVDVIEKEWVEKAEAIVEQTKDDPHAEEEAIEDLQIDYLKKRYGKDIKKSQD